MNTRTFAHVVPVIKELLKSGIIAPEQFRLDRNSLMCRRQSPVYVLDRTIQPTQWLLENVFR